MFLNKIKFNFRSYYGIEMINFLTKIKNVLPRNLRLILHKLYFDNLMIFYEKNFYFFYIIIFHAFERF